MGSRPSGRPVRIAALYGGTPQNANQVRWRWKIDRRRLGLPLHAMPDVRPDQAHLE